MLKSLATILFLIAGLIVFDIGSSIYSPCEQTSEQQETQKSTKESCGFAAGVSYRWTVAAVDWIDQRHDFVTAASTVIIAIFTIILGVFTVSVARSTRLAASAADLSARAAIALELPLIRTEPVWFSLGDGIANGEHYENFGLQCFEFTNRGRTKAFPIELHWGWIVSDRLPAIPEYKLSKSFELKTSLNETDGTIALYLREFDMGLSQGDKTRITDRNPAVQFRLHLYCCLTYEDFMYGQRSIGFCWKYFDLFSGGKFIADATPAYNQRTP